jgi:uncharacterized DUF497 family protein
MDFEWDEAKRLSNIVKHGLDFVDAVALFDCSYLVGLAKPAGNEQRWVATGVIDGQYVTVVYTLRGEVLRIISMRRARHDERDKYQQVFGG